MAETAFAPLTIACPSCGRPAEDFDIIKQEYRCRFCGGSVSAHEAREKFEIWAHEHSEETAKGVARRGAGGELSCPNCGAAVTITSLPGSDELATAKCEYCETQFVAAPPGMTFTSPDVLIPFFITLDEARARLREWCAENSRRPEARASLAHIDDLRGAYLPYEVVKGPIRFSVSRDSSFRVYTCGGYLDGTAVSTSSRQHNLTLDAMEPFDWSGARAYDHGYTAGQTVKLRDIDESEADRRVADEISAAYLPRVERTMMTRGIDVTELPGGDRIRASALLPAYLLDFTLGTGDEAKTIHVAINGQTGRVAVQSAKRREIGRFWFLMPAGLTAAAAAIAWFFARDWEIVGMLSIVFGMILFTMFSQYGIDRHTREVVMSGARVRARRAGRELVYESGDSLPPATAPPVFFEGIRGVETPVDLKFFGPLRMARTITLAGIITFLPAVISAIFALRVGVPLAQVEWGYSAAWFCITFVVVPVYLLRYGFNWIFDSPIVREILPNGSLRTVRPAELDVSVGSSDDFKSNVRMLAKTDKRAFGCAMALILFILFGSVGATVSSFPEPAEVPGETRALTAGEAFVAHVPEFAAVPIGHAYKEFFAWASWGAGEIDGRSCISFSGTLRIDDKPRPVQMIFDVSDYERGGEIKMELVSMTFRDTGEAVRDDLAARIIRAPFDNRR